MQKVFLYDPTLIHSTWIIDQQTDGRIDDRQMTMVSSTPTA